MIKVTGSSTPSTGNTHEVCTLTLSYSEDNVEIGPAHSTPQRIFFATFSWEGSNCIRVMLSSQTHPRLCSVAWEQFDTGSMPTYRWFVEFAKAMIVAYANRGEKGVVKLGGEDG